MNQYDTVMYHYVAFMIKSGVCINHYGAVLNHYVAFMSHYRRCMDDFGTKQKKT